MSPLPYLVLSSLAAVEWKWFIILFFFKHFTIKKVHRAEGFPTNDFDLQLSVNH